MVWSPYRACLVFVQLPQKRVFFKMLTAALLIVHCARVVDQLLNFYNLDDMEENPGEISIYKN